ncbi:TPA: thioredoxin [bacterium]|nr:thioredoxin [bacterium]
MGSLHLTDDNFDEEVVKSSLPVLVDFWAPWCGPCQMIAPSIEELAEEFEGRAKVGKLNVDENPVTTASFGIQSIPVLKIFNGGKEIATIVGAVSKDRIAKRIEESL